MDIVASKPDVILGQSLAVIEALLSITNTTPIVFVHVADPVASGLVSNLARPRGNVTGITNIVPSIGGKWLQLLKEIAPAVTRAALPVNPDTQPDRGSALAWLKQTPVSFPILFDADSKVSKLYGVAGMPTTVFIDRRGNVRMIHESYNPGDENAYLNEIRSLVRE